MSATGGSGAPRRRPLLSYRGRRLASYRGRRLAAGVAALAAALVTVPLAASAASAPPRAAIGADGRLAVAVVLPVVVPPATGGLLTESELSAYTAPGGILARDLDAAANQPVTLAVDPRIIASIRVLGDQAPDTARQWLTRLSAVSNETFALSYADADPVGPGQAGYPTALEPLGFTDAIDPADFAGAANPTASPTPTENPTAKPALPTTPDAVLDWNWSLTGVVWPAAGTVVAADLPRLASQGYTSALLDSSNLGGGAAGHVSLPGVTTLSGIVTDGDLGDALQAAAAAQGVDSAQAADAVLGSELGGAAAEPGSADRVIALDRTPARSVDRLPQVLGAIAARTDARLTTLAEVEQTRASAASVVDLPESADRIAAITSTLSLAALDTTFSSVAVDPTEITAPRRRALLALLSLQWIGNPQFANRVDEFRTESTRLRDGIRIAPGVDALALGANAPLPVTVRNGLDVAVKVYAVARPMRPGLTIPADSRRVEVTVQPDSSQTVRIRSESVTNGKVPVRFLLESATGQQLGAAQVRVIDVQAGWETIGSLVVVVLVLGVFGFGIVRRIVRGRRGGADAVVGPGAPADDAPADTASAAGAAPADSDATAGGGR